MTKSWKAITVACRGLKSEGRSVKPLVYREGNFKSMTIAIKIYEIYANLAIFEINVKLE